MTEIELRIRNGLTGASTVRFNMHDDGKLTTPDGRPVDIKVTPDAVTLIIDEEKLSLESSSEATSTTIPFGDRVLTGVRIGAFILINIMAYMLACLRPDRTVFVLPQSGLIVWPPEQLDPIRAAVGGLPTVSTRSLVLTNLPRPVQGVIFVSEREIVRHALGQDDVVAPYLGPDSVHGAIRDLAGHPALIRAWAWHQDDDEAPPTCAISGEPWP